MSKYDELKEAAEAAHTQVIRSHGWEGTIEEAEMLGTDARYLLKANPDAILELIAYAESLEGLYRRHTATEERQMIELRATVDDLSALVRRLVQALTKAAPDNDLPAKAMDYLKRKGLQGSPLRESEAAK